MAEEEDKEVKEASYLIGVDDAGRGPIIGPMVLAGVLIRKETEEAVIKDGAKDSKLLTPKQREHIYELIKQKALAWSAEIITPSEIDTGFGDGLNLNQVEALVAAKIINDLTSRLSTEQKDSLKIILDCPSTNTTRWKECLVGYLREKKLKIHCEHKADFYHPVVSAASIIAKVTRDREIEQLKKKIGIDFGSGYPSDPTTKKFLEKYIDHEGIKKERIMRESWATFHEAKSKNEEKKRGKQASLDVF